MELKGLSLVIIGGQKMLACILVFAALKGSLCNSLKIKIIFRSDHKYENSSGYPTFWNHIVDSIKYKEDHLEVPKVT
jgi:hypothetical protein